MKRILLAGVLAAVMLSALTFCKHAPDLSIEPPFPKLSAVESTCYKDTVYFQNFVLPIVTSSCGKSGCHDANGQRHGITLTDYSNIRDMVSPFSPKNSKLYTVLFSNNEGERMPPSAPLPDSLKSVIYYWIKQGALNNNCECTGFDSTTVTYAATLQPIIKLFCSDCHKSSSNAPALDTRDELIALANNGKLMASLLHTSAKPMPPSYMLSNCDIGRFQVWVNDTLKP